MQSLLKYRYQKKVVDKLRLDDKESPDKSKSGQSPTSSQLQTPGTSNLKANSIQGKSPTDSSSQQQIASTRSPNSIQDKSETDSSSQLQIASTRSLQSSQSSGLPVSSTEPSPSTSSQGQVPGPSNLQGNRTKHNREINSSPQLQIASTRSLQSGQSSGRLSSTEPSPSTSSQNLAPGPSNLQSNSPNHNREISPSTTTTPELPQLQIQDVRSIAETPEFRLSVPSSPVLQKSVVEKKTKNVLGKRGIVVLDSDSEDEDVNRGIVVLTSESEADKPAPGGVVILTSDSEVEKKPNKLGPVVVTSDSDVEVCNEPSPWLSKEYGQRMHNGFQKTHNTKNCEPESPIPSRRKMDQREFEFRVTSLRQMFPGKSQTSLEYAVRNTADIEAATTYLMNEYTVVKPKPKRKRIRTVSISDDSSDSEPQKPKRKRAKPLDESQQTPTKDDKPVPDNLDEKLGFLYEAFPDLPKNVVQVFLEEHDYSIEETTVALTNYDPNSTENSKAGIKVRLVSQTVNRGSIKAIQAARAQAKAARRIDSSGAEDTDGETNDIDFQNGSESELTENVDGDTDQENETQESRAEAELANVLSFFNSAKVEDIVNLPGCSKKKATAIMQVLPFDDFQDLVNKFEEIKALNLIHECKEMFKIRAVVNKLMLRCEKMAERMESLVAVLTSKTSIEEADSDLGYVTKQPSNLSENLTLAPFQLVGLNWLVLMHKQHLNGILGDEMGLGKTIQTISFLAHLLEIGDLGPHVIISPSSTLDNWLRELKKWCPELKVLMYYGSLEDRKEMRLKVLNGRMEEFHVLVTTYAVASGSVEDRALFKKLKIHYAIFDEGHMLKNMTSLRYQGLMRIRASRRLLLTGTPMQNNLMELMSLLVFVMPELFIGKSDHLKKFFTSISRKTTNESQEVYRQETVAHAKNILKPFFLRRIKAEVMKQMPQKVGIVEKVPLAFEQQDLYDDLKRQFCRTVAESQGALKGQAGASMMMQLRKAANHHLLHRRQYDAARLAQMTQVLIRDPSHIRANPDLVYEDMEVMSDFELHKTCLYYECLAPFRLDDEQITDSGKFRFLDQILPEVKRRGDRVLLFSQFTMMLDIVEHYLKSREHSFVRIDGTTPVPERQELIDRYTDDDSIYVFLLSTKAGGLGINLTAANCVILHDIDFNPYNDKQAEDRSHRVGQTKDVTVYRLVSKNTIEEAMMKCAMHKLKLEENVTGSKKKGKEDEQSDVASLLKQALIYDPGDEQADH